MTITEITVATPHGDVGANVRAPAQPSDVGMLLAHGAGAGQSHPWMVGLAERLTAFGVLVMTFDYAYMQAGRKAPDRLPKLLDVHQAAFEAVETMADTIVIGGKSMGGRAGGHLVAEDRAGPAGIVYYGYPLVAIGKTEPRPTDHLESVATPQLFVSGTRDRLGPVDLVTDVAASLPSGTLVTIDSGDHSFVPLKATGLSLDDSLDTAVKATNEWLSGSVLG
ncbi:MAG: alpha/beta family hydrolase [Acidimicrobiia bacterium]